MKKFLVYCLVAIMLVASVSVVASAAASDWTKGNGFDVYQAADPASPKTTAGRVLAEKNSPVTVADADGEYGVSVAHKGYYESGDNWGGVVSNEKFGLNGLEVTVKFDEVPVVDGSDDCWIALDLVKEARSFRTNDPYNCGLIDLIRFGRPEIELYGAQGWGNIGKSGINGSDFAVKSGDTLKLSVRYEFGQYIVTFAHNDATYEFPADTTLDMSDNVFTEGDAHVLVMASCFGLDKNFKYTVNVKPGVALTEEEIANKAFEKEKAVQLRATEKIAKEVADIIDNAKELAGESTDTDITDKVAAIEAVADVVAAKIEAVKAATTEDEAKAAADEAVSAKSEAEAAFDELEAYVESFGGDDNAADDAKDDESNEPADTDNTSKVVDDDDDDNGGVPVWVWVVIVVVVVAIVVVAVVLGKKKKK